VEEERGKIFEEFLFEGLPMVGMLLQFQALKLTLVGLRDLSVG